MQIKWDESQAAPLIIWQILHSFRASKKWSESIICLQVFRNKQLLYYADVVSVFCKPLLNICNKHLLMSPSLEQLPTVFSSPSVGSSWAECNPCANADCVFSFPQQALTPLRKRHSCQSWKSSVIWETTWTLLTFWEPALLEVLHFVLSYHLGPSHWKLQRWFNLCLFVCRPHTGDHRVLLLRRPSQLPAQKERIIYLL